MAAMKRMVSCTRTLGAAGMKIKRCADLVMMRPVSTSNVASDIFDVVIVGAGVVGAALACKLAEAPSLRSARIAIVEARAPAPLTGIAPSSPPDLRTFAITPASRRVFESIGVWSRMEAVRASAFSHMQVWDALGPGHVRFAATDSGAMSLGWIVENQVLQGALYGRLQELALEGRLHLVCPSSLRALHFPGAGGSAAVPGGAQAAQPHGESPHALARVDLADGSVLHARLVVGADGASSRVREAARVGTGGWDYDSRAVVATVKTDGHGNTAWQRFLPNGPVAVLPLWDDWASVVWSTTPAHAEALVQADNNTFTQALNTVLTAPTLAFEQVLRGETGGPHSSDYHARHTGDDPPPPGGPSDSRANGGGGAESARQLYDQQRDTLWLDPMVISSRMISRVTERAMSLSRPADRFQPPPSILASHGSRASFPLRTAKANAYIGARMALVGDAAHTVHPLAGQGLNLGVGDADHLADVLIKAAHVGSDLGSVGVLRTYERSRAAHNLLVMAALDGIKRVFAAGMVGPAEEPWAALRNLGMTLLNCSSATKSLTVSLASRTQRSR